MSNNKELENKQEQSAPSPKGEGATNVAGATQTAALAETPLISQPAADSFPPRGSQEEAPAGTSQPSPQEKVNEGAIQPSPFCHSEGAEATEESPRETAGATQATTKKKATPSSIIMVVLSSVLLIMAVFIFTTSVAAKINGSQPEFFGYSFSIVLTDSMTPEIKVGELVVVRRCDISEAADAYIEDGEKLNIVFISRSGTLEGERIVHKVYSVSEDEDGIYIQTKGEKEGAPVDSECVRSDNFVGVAVYHSAVLGNIVSFLSNARNWIIIAVLAALVIFSYKQVKKIIKYVKEEKKEKN